jgi:carboxymethylenebutenolidase
VDQKVLDLYGDYECGRINRRDFMVKVAVLVGSVTVAGQFLAILEDNQALAEMIAPDDARLSAEMINYPGPNGDVQAYFAKPKGDEKLPGVVVIHENRGLNDHIKDVTRRVAVEGFLALAPDALSAAGGTPPDQPKAIEMIRGLDPKTNLDNFLAAAKYMATIPESTGKVGVMGFCWGGGMSNQLAVHSPEVIAAVPYYGRQPAVEDVPKIKASLLLHYAGEDEWVNPGIPDYEAALKKAGVDYQLFTYPGAKHAFNNDTNPERYNKEAADLAWQRTIAFLKEKLKT